MSVQNSIVCESLYKFGTQEQKQEFLIPLASGEIIGAFALVLFPEVFRELGSMRILVFAVVMLIIMLYRPEGIWPAKKT